MEDRFLSMVFIYNIDIMNVKIPLIIKIAIRLGFNKRNIIYNAKLDGTREDLPFQIFCNINNYVLNNQRGFLLHIRSEPVILFKMRQLGHRPNLDDFRYSDIIETNKHFINQIIYGTGGVIIEEPKVMAEIIHTPFIEIMKNLGYNKIADLLKQGDIKLERGDIEDGLTDLRSALELFIKDLVQKIGENPQNNIPSNLEILQKHGYIDEHLYKVIKETLYEWMYRYLSNKSVHKREKININDAKLFFSI